MRERDENAYIRFFCPLVCGRYDSRCTAAACGIPHGNEGGK